MTEGYKQSEIAEELGQKPSWVSERLSALRDSYLLQQNLFFPLADQEYQALRDSITEHGVTAPIIIGEHIPLVDGRHRLLISEELGRTEIPAVFLTGLTAEAERELAISLNTARRQLNRAQKRTLVESELMRDPARSDRRIATICGVHWDTVGVVRSEIAEAQRRELEEPEVAETASESVPVRWGGPEHEQSSAGITAPAPITDITRDYIAAHAPRVPVEPEIRVDSAGAHRPAPPARPTQADEVDRPLGRVQCGRCAQNHLLFRDGAGFRIETV